MSRERSAGSNPAESARGVRVRRRGCELRGGHGHGRGNRLDTGRRCSFERLDNDDDRD